MKDTLLAEFVCDDNEERSIILDTLGSVNENDIKILKGHVSYEHPIFVQVEMSPEIATIIKLKFPYLSERMRIFHISNEIKDKYRR